MAQLFFTQQLARFPNVSQVDTAARELRSGLRGEVWISENGGDSWRTLSTTLPPVYAVTFD